MLSTSNPCGPSCGSPESWLASGRSLYRLAPNLSKIAATLATGHRKATGAQSSSLAAKRTCPHNRDAFLCFRSVACSMPRLGYRRNGTSRQSVAGCEAVRHSAGLRIGSLAPSARNYRSWSMARHQDVCHGRHLCLRNVLVFITKSRHRAFDGDAIKRLRGLFSELAQRHIHISRGMLREQRPDLTARYGKDVLWSPSYFAASCGVHLATF